MIHKKWTLLIVVILSSSLVGTAMAEKILYKDSSGLEVILESNPFSSIVTYSFIIKTGARDEPDDMHGATHMLEHLIFNGSDKYTQKELYDEVARIGAYNNAATGRAATTYIMLVPFEQAEKALELQTEMLFRSTMPEEKFEKERGIITEEINKSHSESYYIVDNFFASSLFPGKGYSHPILGDKNDIKNMNREKIYNYYKKFYHPGNMILRVTGNFDVNRMKKMIQKYVPSPTKPFKAKKTEYAAPDFNSKKLYVLCSDEMKIFYFNIVFPAPGINSKDTAAYMLWLKVLENRLNLDFKKSLKVPVMRIALDYVPYENEGFLNITMLTPPAGNPSMVAGALIDYIYNAGTELPEKKEIDIAKVLYSNEQLFLAEKPHIDTFMKGPILATGGVNILDKINNNVSKVTPGDIRRIKFSYFVDKKGFAGTVVKPKSETPEDGYVKITQNEINRSKALIIPSEPEEKINIPTIQTQPRKSEGTFGRRDFILQNGMKLGVIQTPDSPVLAIHLLIKNRSYLEPAGKSGIASLMNRLLLSGTKQFNSRIINYVSDSMGIKLTTNDNPMIPFDDIYNSPLYSYIKLETTRDYLAPAFAFLYNIMYHSSFPEDAIKEKKREQIIAISRKARSSRCRAMKEFYSTLFGSDHPLASDTLGSQKSVSSITQKDLLEFRKKYYSPDNLIMTVSSDQDINEIAHIVNTIFGVEKDALNPLIVKAFQNTDPKHIEEVKTVPGNGKQGYLVYGYLLNYKTADIPGLEVATRMISNRLSFLLREKHGLAYSLGADIDFYKYNCLFKFTIGTDSSNIDKTVELLKNELGEMKTWVPSKLEFESARNEYVGRLGMRTNSRINYAYYTGLGMYLYRNVNYVADHINSLKKLSLQDVQAGLKIVLGDFEGKKPLLIQVK